MFTRLVVLSSCYLRKFLNKKNPSFPSRASLSPPIRGTPTTAISFYNGRCLFGHLGFFVQCHNQCATENKRDKSVIHVLVLPGFLSSLNLRGLIRLSIGLIIDMVKDYCYLVDVSTSRQTTLILSIVKLGYFVFGFSNIVQFFPFLTR